MKGDRDISEDRLVAYLEPTEVIDFECGTVRAVADGLQCSHVEETVRHCFNFVRDEIPHTFDRGKGPVTCNASDVLKHGTGICFAKSHLLAALLRANRIPAGICYQRIQLNPGGTEFILHGLNAVHLPDAGWLKFDARGNAPDKGIITDFSPPDDCLAFPVQNPGERLIETIFTRPIDPVVKVLSTHQNLDHLEKALPDWEESNND